MVKTPAVGLQSTLTSDSSDTFSRQACVLFTLQSATLTHSYLCFSLLHRENVYNAGYRSAWAWRPHRPGFESHSLWDLDPILRYLAGCELGIVTHLLQRLLVQCLAHSKYLLTLATVSITVTRPEHSEGRDPGLHF